MKLLQYKNPFQSLNLLQSVCVGFIKQPQISTRNYQISRYLLAICLRFHMELEVFYHTTSTFQVTSKALKRL